jgi:CRISPR-associated exonuclease Cas4
MIKLSHLTSYITCPRLCYYRLHYGESSFTEFAAIREIYLSYRQGFDFDWARKRAESLYDTFNGEIFENAAKNFIAPGFDFKSLEIDVLLKSEKLNLLVSVEEIVEKRGEKVPLFLNLVPPEKGVWLKDTIKAGAASLAAGFSKALIYYAYTGDIREVEVTFGVKRKVIKLVERVKLVQKGFLPERRESGYCNNCSFREECNRKPETFASKFL